MKCFITSSAYLKNIHFVPPYICAEKLVSTNGVLLNMFRNFSSLIGGLYAEICYRKEIPEPVKDPDDLERLPKAPLSWEKLGQGIQWVESFVTENKVLLRYYLRQEIIKGSCSMRRFSRKPYRKGH